MKTDTGKLRGLSIFHKLLLGFIGSSLLIILLMGSVYYYYAEERVNAYVNSEIATGLKNAVSFFKSNYADPINSDLTLLEASPSFDNFFTVSKEEANFVRFDIEKMFYRLFESKGGRYKELVFFDAYGQEEIAVKNRRRARNFSSISQYGKGDPYGQGKARLFTRLKKASPGTVLFEGPVNDSDNKQMLLAGISKREPEIAGFGGVIMLSCDLTNYITYLANVKVFDRQIAWLLNEDGNILLAPPNREELVDPRPYLAKESNSGGDPTGIHFHETFIHCHGCVLGSIKQSSLRIAFSVPRDIFSELMGEVLLSAFMVIALVLCIAILISYFLARQFVRPIVELSRASKLLGKGDFEVEINKDSGGEIGELAMTFDKMAKELHQSIKTRDQEITSRKQAEKEILKAKAEWEKSFNAITDIVTLQDPEMNILRVNKATCSFFELQEWEIVGKKCYEIFRNSTEPCPDCPEVKTLGDRNSHSQIIVHKNLGKTFQVSTAPIIDVDDNIEYIVHVAKDITIQKNLEQELFQSHKMEAIGVLAGGIAHDFNNILAAILGNINLALYDQDLKDKTRKLLSEAEKASIRAKDLTQQLLTFSKGGDPIKEISSLGNVIKDSANFVLHGDKVICRFDIPEDLWLVDVDKGQMSQVVQNIVINASQAMPEGGTVTINCENVRLGDEPENVSLGKGRFIKISIQDDGIGMSADVVEKVFDPYFSTKPGGSGLGLAITRSIISKHKGHVSVKSSPNVGTTFTLYLPASEKMKELKQELIIGSKASSHAKILIMDDEEMVRTVAQAMLVQLGHEVVLAADGDEALNFYQEAINAERLFDLVIMDLTIPGGMGGEETVRKILDIAPDAKVVVSSGYSNDPIMANYKEYGFCSALVKPYQMEELARIISQVSD